MKHLPTRSVPAKFISIAAARKICTRLSTLLPSHVGLAAFGATGEVQSGFVREVRSIESAKADLLSARSIGTDDYWAVVKFDSFVNHHLDDGFQTLLRAYSKSVRMEASASHS